MNYSNIPGNAYLLTAVKQLNTVGKQPRKLIENNDKRYINLEKSISPDNKIIKVNLQKKPYNNKNPQAPLSTSSTINSVKSNLSDKKKHRYCSSDISYYNNTNSNLNYNYSNNSLIDNNNVSFVKKHFASSMDDPNNLIRKRIFKNEKSNMRELLLNPKRKQNIFVKKNSFKTNSLTKSIDSIEEKNENENEYNTINNNNIYNIKRTKLDSETNEFKIEDILLLKERLDDIIHRIINNNENIICESGASNECFEYLLFYFNSSLVGKIHNFFVHKNKIIALSSNNLCLLSIVLTYTISLDYKLLSDYKILLTNIFPIIRNNFLLEVKQILFFFNNNSIDIPNSEIYFSFIKKILIKNKINEKNEDEIVNKITKNCKIIVDYSKIIINQMSKDNYPNSKELLTIFYNISKIDNNSINNFFLNKALKIENQNKSIINSYNIIKQYINNSIKVPYIKIPSTKKFSLVLDLDETLISLKLNNNNKGILKFRPGLFDFLDNLKPFYELISFTCGTRIYAEPILNEIESKKKYFDKKLFREHAIIIGKDFVKDISRIGRDMSKICIVDNISINYRLNKENGILIYPFYEDNNKFDKTLFELKKILIDIHKKFNDIREGLVHFKDDIVTKVSGNIYSL